MIQIKTPAQIEAMRKAGRITGEAILLAGEAIKPGVTTKKIRRASSVLILKNAARSLHSSDMQASPAAHVSA